MYLENRIMNQKILKKKRNKRKKDSKETDNLKVLGNLIIKRKANLKEFERDNKTSRL